MGVLSYSVLLKDAVMSLCIHDLPPEQCGSCKPLPSGVPKTVFITQGGDHYHYEERCPALLDGWAEARRQGFRNHAPQTIGWGDASMERDPCHRCVPGLIR